MFLHTSSTAVTRLLCAAPYRAMMVCSLHDSCPTRVYASTQWQGITQGSTHQHTTQNWCSRLLWLSAINPSMYHGCQWVAGRNTAAYSTASSSSEHAHTTAQGVLREVSSEVKGDEVDHKALVELEVELYRQEGCPVPSTFTERQWEELLTLPSVNGRRRYLTFLFKNEKKRENKKKIKKLQKEKREEEYRLMRENPPDGSGHIEYGLWKNSIFLKILDSSMTHFYHSRVVQAIMYGQPLVVDLAFDKHMTKKEERQNCAYQLQIMMSANRKHKDPYNIELHNALPTHDTVVRLHRYIPVLYKPEYPVLINEGSYLDKYPREQLVYLTPHCNEELLTYDHNAVYIIGGIVDKSSAEPVTLAKAKREGIRMKKLPLERYLSWGLGNKCLTLNQIIEIMLDFKLTGDWPYALRHVPRRKLQPPPQSQQAREEALLKQIQRRERGYKFY